MPRNARGKRRATLAAADVHAHNSLDAPRTLVPSTRNAAFTGRTLVTGSTSVARAAADRAVPGDLVASRVAAVDTLSPEVHR